MTKDFRIAGVIGYPVAHSLSPLLHNGWLKDLGIAGAYLPLEVRPQDLPQAIAGLKALGFAGANVTIPHKEAVIPLTAAVDATARAVGAVNTLVIENGRILGRNTDVEGFLAHLEASVPGWKAKLDGRGALVLGAGGAARAVLYALSQASVTNIVLANRSAERASTLARTSSAIRVVAWEKRHEAVSGAGLIINTTSLGMRGQPPLELDLARAHKGAIVYDLVYNPLPTDLLRKAKGQGLQAIDGLGMLVHQARAGFKAWFGAEPPVTPEIFRRLAAALPSA
jgi:shikimate dehydrogenase